MQVACPNCGTEFQVIDPDSRKFSEQVMKDCLAYAKEARELRAKIYELETAFVALEQQKGGDTVAKQAKKKTMKDKVKESKKDKKQPKKQPKE